MLDSLAPLIQRAQSGDATAMGELIASQQTYVYSVAIGIMRNQPDAMDMTQEAFLRVLRVLPTYRGETKFTTWLYRLVANVCLDELRRRGRLPRSFGQDGTRPSVEDVWETDPLAQPEAFVSAAETAREVRQALAALTTAQRLALTLYYFEDMRYEDIAQVMDLPLNTVKSHIRRAKQRLAESVESRHNGKESLTWTAGT